MKFTIYSKSGCSYCDRIKRVLELSEIEHTVLTLGTDFDREKFCEKFGKGSSFPRVLLNDELIGGCTETIKYLKESSVI
jgi:glutaredoxin